jgi:hypothetical protein
MSAISELSRMLGQETVMVTGFLTSTQGVAVWVYFQTDPIHLGFAPWKEGGHGECSVAQNWDIQLLRCASAAVDGARSGKIEPQSEKQLCAAGHAMSATV